MVRRRAKTASEQTAHWHHVLVYCLFSTFSAFCVLFLADSEKGMVKECSFSPLCTSRWVYCSLNVGMLEMIWPVKCGSIGNPLEGQYPGPLSIFLCPLSCQWPMPSPASAARTFSSNFLPCVCPIAAIDSWTVLMWPRLHSQHITLPLVTLPLFLVQADINWLD